MGESLWLALTAVGVGLGLGVLVIVALKTLGWLCPPPRREEVIP